ncbi:MAG: AbrB/MazE/SpoVT family DNA-binding domain-containing protein [Chloroflexia bacterium]
MALDTQSKRTIRPLRDGRITIPAEFRRALGIADESLLAVSIEDDGLRIRKVDAAETNGHDAWLSERDDPFASVHDDFAARGVPVSEINAAIDAARRELRRALLDRLAQERKEQGQGNPWLQLSGIFKDDPFADEVDEAIAAYRRELDAQDGAA